MIYPPLKPKTPYKTHWYIYCSGVMLNSGKAEGLKKLREGGTIIKKLYSCTSLVPAYRGRVVSTYENLGLCTHKWGNSALVESLVQSH